MSSPKKRKIANIQQELERITGTVYHLHVAAHRAYQSYIREYALRNSAIFDVLSLNIIDVAKSFGLSAPPKMTVQLRKIRNIRPSQCGYKQIVGPTNKIMMMIMTLLYDLYD
eukprot:TRINITY_DN23683_c0_g1_i1.p1 TRINITY_DN23683_c0_g1~~TRINITY_DN23683_c0_g1_i1.p1  ORF type:complete len:112 (-),score=5.44 TRINITY_DN23683_c0_g1_i1:106-441(-)